MHLENLTSSHTVFIYQKIGSQLISHFKKPNSQSESLEFLKTIGFKVNTTYEKKNLNEANSYYKYWESAKDSLAYATDGIVVKIDKFETQNLLGATNKAQDGQSLSNIQQKRKRLS